MGVKLHLGDSENVPSCSQDDGPPKKLLRTESHNVSYAESIDCAKHPCPPFYLTKVTGIADVHNSPDVAIGIKGESSTNRIKTLFYTTVDILSPAMGDLEASAQVCTCVIKQFLFPYFSLITCLIFHGWSNSILQHSGA